MCYSNQSLQEAGGMLVHKVTVIGKRGISWIERRAREVVLIFRGGRVGRQCA